MITQQELIESHRSGFGGSDAKMFAKIGKYGVDSLSMTEARRIMQVLGKVDMPTWGGNVYTDAGHQFEEWMRGQDTVFGYVQEQRLNGPSQKSFTVFAHADFYSPDLEEVVECKYSQSETHEVLTTYWFQLQWYYMLGVKSVVLAHGHGGVFPFAVEGVEYVPVDRDEATVSAILDGIVELQDAIDGGVFKDMRVEADIMELSSNEREAATLIVAATKEIKRYEKMMAEARDMLCKTMEMFGLMSIKGDGFTVSYVAPSERRSFDSKKAVKDFPELSDEKYYKTSAVKASVRVTIDKEDEQ